MKILHIATQVPGHTSGGEIGTLQFSYALTHMSATVDYVGPTIHDDEVTSWYNTLSYIDSPISKLKKVWTFVHFQFDRKYVNWKKLRIDFDKYDLIFIEFTKLNYVLNTILKSEYKGKIIIRAHNVESDFAKIELESKKTFMNLLRYALIHRREKFMVKNADAVLAITENDKRRLIELYGCNEEKIRICPVGVGIPQEKHSFKSVVSDKLKCLITGSLWFGPNSEATLWFINNVYPDVKDICDVTIAGFKPRNEIKEKCDKNGIGLIDSPESMQPYFEESEMVLAPIFDGGGMKVKIAEAMSYGLPIVTTSHGAIGYKIQNGVNGYITDTAQGFTKAIRAYYELSEDERINFLDSEWELYTENYSVLAIRDFCKNMIKDLK